MSTGRVADRVLVITEAWMVQATERRVLEDLNHEDRIKYVIGEDTYERIEVTHRPWNNSYLVYIWDKA